MFKACEVERAALAGRLAAYSSMKKVGVSTTRTALQISQQL
jgi:hypothetical protein